jgi:hypothetical protein
MNGLYDELELDARETADCHHRYARGHLDMDVATMPAQPEDAKRVIANARAALTSYATNAYRSFT